MPGGQSSASIGAATLDWLEPDGLSADMQVDEALRARLSRMGLAVLPNTSIGVIGDHRTLSMVVALRQAAGRPLADVEATAAWVERHLGTRLDAMSSTWRAGSGSASDRAALRSVVEAVFPDIGQRPPNLCILVPRPDGKALLIDPLRPHGAPPLRAEEVTDNAFVLVDWRDGFEAVHNHTRGHGRESLSSLLMELGTTHDDARELADTALIDSGMALSDHAFAVEAEIKSYLHQFAEHCRAGNFPPLKAFIRRVMKHEIPARFYREVKQASAAQSHDRIADAINRLARIGEPTPGSTAFFIAENLQVLGLQHESLLQLNPALYDIALWLDSPSAPATRPTLPELVESIRLRRHGAMQHSDSRDNDLRLLVNGDPVYVDYMSSPPGWTSVSHRALVALVAGHSARTGMRTA